MSEIALYDTLRKIDGVTDAEAKEAVADVANSKDVATKMDLLELKYQLTWRMIIVGLGVAAIVIAAVGLMIRFL